MNVLFQDLGGVLFGVRIKAKGSLLHDISNSRIKSSNYYRFAFFYSALKILKVDKTMHKKTNYKVK